MNFSEYVFKSRFRNIIAYAIVVAAMVYGFIQVDHQAAEIEQEAHQRAYRLCVAGNESRQAIRDAFDQYTDALASASARNSDPGENTPAEIARREKRVAEFEADIDKRLEPLHARDCGPPPAIK